MRAAVGRLHHAGAAAGADVELLFLRQLQAVGGHGAAELARGFVVAGVAHHALGRAQGVGVATGLGGGQALGCLLGRQEARAAVHHHGVGDAGFRQVELGFEHFELNADAARVAPQQELGVGEGEAVGVGLQGLAAVGMGLQLGPGIGQRGSGGELDVFGGFHGLLF